ncbi:MAG TPA: sodium-dependent transporter [Ruminococcaceae bacterium]|nr:sodium-dependent transporter [Oscillospiraceae bacterium]
MERESFKSRLGFILVSAGCAIGIGNVWKFPFIAGQNGGGIFVLIYLFFLAIMGIPILTMEFAIGRGSRKSIVGAYKTLEPKKSKWHIHGWLCIAGCYLLMMYYSTVSGWMVDYGWKFASGQFEGIKSADEVSNIFGSMLSDPWELILFTAIMVVGGFFVCSIGIKNGLERVNKFMMLALLLLIIILAFNSLTLSGVGEGLKFYLIPDMNKVNKIGWINVISSAMNQAFFTLSLGIASMEIFGSYMSKDNTLLSESVRITALDTFVAIMSGLIIFPACFSFGVEPGEGPSLIFLALPNIFLHMPGGRIWGTLFFLFMSFASFSTVTAVYENLISSSMDNFKWSRKKSTVINCLFMLAACLPCVFGFNIWSDFHIIGGLGMLDSEDFIVSNILLPLGALLFLMFCTTKRGWGFDNYLAEVNSGKGMKLKKGFKIYLKYVLPLLLGFIFVYGLITKNYSG